MSENFIDGVRVIKILGWSDYSSKNAQPIDANKCGKWLYFFDFLQSYLIPTEEAEDLDGLIGWEFAEKICMKAIQENVCTECKHTDCFSPLFQKIGAIPKSGVICFYCNGDDVEAHKRILQFMLNNQLVPKTKAGKLYNISFKFDNQTRAGEYGADFEGKIKLEQFIDLWTGEWK